MIAPLAKFIDWTALQMAYVVAPLRHAPKPKWKLEEALEFLNGPDFIPAASNAAQIEFDRPRHFKFPTPRPGAPPRPAKAELRRCGKRPRTCGVSDVAKPPWWESRDSNPGPPACEAGALTN